MGLKFTRQRPTQADNNLYASLRLKENAVGSMPYKNPTTVLVRVRSVVQSHSAAPVFSFTVNDLATRPVVGHYPTYKFLGTILGTRRNMMFKDPHCKIGTILIKAEHRPPGKSFVKRFRSPEGSYKLRWLMSGISADGRYFRYERDDTRREDTLFDDLP